MNGEKADCHRCMDCGDLFLRDNYEEICKNCARKYKRGYKRLE